MNTFIGDGRNFNRDDVRFSRNVCILGMDVVDRLFPIEDPIGKKIQLKGLDYFVIGTAERKGEAFGSSQDNYLSVPISNYLERFSNHWTTLSINVEARSELEYSKTMDEAIGLMRAIRKVPPDKEKHLAVARITMLLFQFLIILKDFQIIGQP